MVACQWLKAYDRPTAVQSATEEEGKLLYMVYNYTSNTGRMDVLTKYLKIT